MKNIEKADYLLATNTAVQFLIDENITTFPINIGKIIKKNKWYLSNYTDTANAIGVSYKQLKHALNNSWGTVSYDGYNYAILYDDLLCKGAQLFTILHEIGHIKMNHLTRNGCIYIRNDLALSGDVKSYENMELETNCFARNVATPVVLVDHSLTQSNINQISIQFGITPKAAKSRLDFYNIDIKNIGELNIHKLHKHFDKSTYPCHSLTSVSNFTN